MLKNDYIFPALFTYDTKGITINFPNLLGAITVGDTEEEALLMAKECLELDLYGMEEDKDEMDNKVVKKTLIIPKWLNDEAVSKNKFFCSFKRGIKRRIRH